MRLTRLSLTLLGLAGLLLAYVVFALLARKEPSMNSIYDEHNPALIRTDFSDDKVWQAICSAVKKIPSDLREGIDIMKAMNAASGNDVSRYDQSLEFVNIIDDPQYADRTTEEVLDLVAKRTVNACLFIVDRHTITNPDHPILVVDLPYQPGRTFRTIPSEVWAIASNLSIANMDWEDFANLVNSDGVFRGYPPPNR
jgi:hypothetical protein